MGRIERFPIESTCKMSATAGDSSIIDKGEHTTGAIQLPSGSSTTQVNIYSQVKDGSWAQAEDEDGIDIQMTGLLADVPRNFPSSVYNLPRIKLVAESIGATDPETVNYFITS